MGEIAGAGGDRPRGGLGCALHPWLDQRADYLDAMATFDGYANPAPLNYPITIPVFPPERYGLINVTRILSSRGPFFVQPYSIGIGREPMKTDAGQSLQKGQTYRFYFKRRWYDRRWTCRMKISAEP